MKRSTPSSQNLDDRLAEFTDLIISGQADQTESNADDELRDLEETILRLNHLRTEDRLEEATIKRMSADFARRRRMEASRQKERQENSFMSFLRNLFTGHAQQWQTAFVAMAVIIGIVGISLLTSNGANPGSLTGSAGTQSQVGGIVIFTGGLLVLLLIWLGRKK